MNVSSTGHGNYDPRSLVVDGTGVSEVFYPVGFECDTDNQDFAIVKIPGNGNGTIGGFVNAGIKLRDLLLGIASNEVLYDMKLQGGNPIVARSSQEAGGVNPSGDFGVSRFNSTSGAQNSTSVELTTLSTSNCFRLDQQKSPWL